MTDPVPWLEKAPSLAAGNWRHGWTTSRGPDFRSDPASTEHAACVDELVRSVGLEAGAWVRQVHGGSVLEAAAGGFTGEADALWSTRPGLGVVGRGADCPLVLVAGPLAGGAPIWGFAHASWRSTLLGITAGLLLALKGKGAQPAELKAVICPSAGPCCFEVGDEVRQSALGSLGPGAAWFFMERSGRLRFDLWAANIAQLTAAGVPAGHIHNVQHCTICGGNLYPSFRRDGDRAGRFAAVIGS